VAVWFVVLQHGSGLKVLVGRGEGQTMSPASLVPSMTWLRARAPSMMDLHIFTDAIDGDIPAALEVSTLFLAVAGTGRALAQTTDPQQLSTSRVSSTPAVIGLDVNLGEDGEPAGVNRVYLKRLLPHSELVVVSLPVPLGLLVEEKLDDGGTVVVGHPSKHCRTQFAPGLALVNCGP